MSSARRVDSGRAVVAAFGLYLAWTAATYLLEGRLGTLHRPDAVGARFIYALVANLTVGIAGGIWLTGRLARKGLSSPSSAGFGTPRRAAVFVLLGLTLGLALYALQGAPTWDPVVLMNAFAQVVVVSAAEVIVCWVVLASLLESAVRPWNKVRAYGGAIIISGLFFGLYHFAHSPPFNTPEMVALLAIVGLASGGFFFLTRDVYGTIAFHNMLALYGVVDAMAAGGGLSALQRPLWPLLGMAIVAIGLLIAGHAWLLRQRDNASDALPAT